MSHKSTRKNHIFKLSVSTMRKKDKTTTIPASKTTSIINKRTKFVVISKRKLIVHILKRRWVKKCFGKRKTLKLITHKHKINTNQDL